MKLNRWIYAAAGVVVLLFAGLVYAWSVLSRPLAAHFTEWSSAQLSLTFTICMSFFCLGGLAAGVLAGNINVKINMLISAVLFLAGFFIASRMESPAYLYIGYGVLGGTASGFAYNTTMGTITKYFPDKPGLISGILLMGFGMGSFIIGKVYQALTGSGEAFRNSFLGFGIILFVVMLISCFFIRKPETAEIEQYLPDRQASAEHVAKGVEGLEMNAAQMLKRHSFWMYFVWAVLLSAAGLALISQAGAVASEVNPAASAGTISTVVGLISIFNGVGRVIFGGMFDKVGRAKTMVMVDGVFIAAVVLIILSMTTGSFVILIGGFIVAGLAYGGITPTNSAFVGAFYGKKNYAINFSMINMNLLVASFGSTMAGMLYDMSGSYFTTLIVMAGAIVVGSVIGLLIRRP